YLGESLIKPAAKVLERVLTVVRAPLCAGLAALAFVLITAVAAHAQYPMPIVNPAPPTIPAGNFNITNYGAVSSTTLTNTTAILNAISAAAGSANHGGTVEIPPGTYLSGPLTLKSSVNLQIDPGALLQMLPESKWPGSTTFINGS